VRDDTEGSWFGKPGEARTLWLRALAADRDVTPMAIAMGVYLSTMSDPEVKRPAWPCAEWLAARLDTLKPSVLRAIKVLERRGYLGVCRRDGHTPCDAHEAEIRSRPGNAGRVNLYRLLLPPGGSGGATSAGGLRGSRRATSEEACRLPRAGRAEVAHALPEHRIRKEHTREHSQAPSAPVPCSRTGDPEPATSLPPGLANFVTDGIVTAKEASRWARRYGADHLEAACRAVRQQARKGNVRSMLAELRAAVRYGHRPNVEPEDRRPNEDSRRESSPRRVGEVLPTLFPALVERAGPAVPSAAEPTDPREPYQVALEAVRALGVGPLVEVQRRAAEDQGDRRAAIVRQTIRMLRNAGREIPSALRDALASAGVAEQDGTDP